MYKNNKGLVETYNCLKPAPKKFPWHIHAGGKKEGYSLIRFVAADYSNGKGDKLVSAYANLQPEDVLFLFARLCFGFEHVELSQQKIYNDREKGGIVTILNVTRNAYVKDGKEREHPWMINIRNGTGVAAYNRNGGQYCKKGSYREEKNVSIYLDDREMFRLLYRTCAVIVAFEQKGLYRDRDTNNFQTLYHLLKKELRLQIAERNGDDRLSERKAA
ncbi:MAG: hypothetical protein ACLSFZ_00660 [Frisingicoccus sp.]